MAGRPERAAAPRTQAGRALVGWIRPKQRGPWPEAVAATEIEAARDVLATLRDRVGGLRRPCDCGLGEPPGGAPGGPSAKVEVLGVDAVRRDPPVLRARS